ncbi:MAG: hypothetical protein WCP55_17450 [Lentisphaerota bacterium]
MKNFIVDIPELKAQYRAVLHSQKRQGTTKRSRTLLEGVLNFFDDIITAEEHGRISLTFYSVPTRGGLKMKGAKDGSD